MLNPDPKKFYKLPEAFDALGCKRFGDDWTGAELTARDLPDPDLTFKKLVGVDGKVDREQRAKFEKAKKAAAATSHAGPRIFRKPLLSTTPEAVTQRRLETIARHAGLKPYVVKAARVGPVAYQAEFEAHARRDSVIVELRRIFFNERARAMLQKNNGELIDLAGARWFDNKFLVDFASGRAEWAGLVGLVLIDRHEFDDVVLGQADQAPADLPIAESPRGKAAVPPPSNLTNEARSKGGSRSRRDAGLQQFIDQLFAKFEGEGIILTPSRLKVWLENNILPDQTYSAEPWIPNCDEIEFIDDLIWWIDGDGNKKNKSRRSVDRYILMANDRASREIRMAEHSRTYPHT